MAKKMEIKEIKAYALFQELARSRNKEIIIIAGSTGLQGRQESGYQELYYYYRAKG